MLNSRDIGLVTHPDGSVAIIRKIPAGMTQLPVGTPRLPQQEASRMIEERISPMDLDRYEEIQRQIAELRTRQNQLTWNSSDFRQALAIQNDINLLTEEVQNMVMMSA